MSAQLDVAEILEMLDKRVALAIDKIETVKEPADRERYIGKSVEANAIRNVIRDMAAKAAEKVAA
jgi:hypothetical protein